MTKLLDCATCGEPTEHVLVEEQRTGSGEIFYSKYRCGVCETDRPG